MIKWPLRPIVGLDIGNRTIKGLKLRKKAEKVFLENYFFYDLSESNAKFPNVNGLENTLKALVEVAGFKNQFVSSCIDDSEVSTFDLILPPMSQKDLASAVASELESKIGFPIEEASIDFVVVGKNNANGEENLEIKAYVARLVDIESFVSVIKATTLKPESLDVAMLANIAMLDFNGYLDAEAHVVVVDMGETKTNTALIKGKKLIAANSIPIALGSINRRLQEATGVNYLEAEKIKIRSSQKHDDEESATQQIVDNVYLELFQQLHRSIEFFKVAAQGKPLAKIFLLGGGSQFSSVRATIEATCSTETVVANPFRNIEIFVKGKANNDRLGNLAPQLGTAVGLALRGIDVG